MNSALAAMLGLTLSIILIVKKVSPVYSLILGALIGGLLSGWGLQNTVTEMISGIMEISPAIIRILAAGVLTGMLVKTGAASTISETIIKKTWTEANLFSSRFGCHVAHRHWSIHRCSGYHYCSYCSHCRKQAQFA